MWVLIKIISRASAKGGKECTIWDLSCSPRRFVLRFMNLDGTTVALLPWLLSYYDIFTKNALLPLMLPWRFLRDASLKQW